MSTGKPCTYILNRENCPYGEKCRFLHQYREKRPVATTSTTQESKNDSGNRHSDSNRREGPGSTDRRDGPGNTTKPDGPSSTESRPGPDSTEKRPGPDSTERRPGSGSTERRDGPDSTERRPGPVSTDRRRPQSRGRNLKRKARDSGDPEEGKPVPPRVCRFYVANSRCKFGDKCRYVHPEILPNMEGKSGEGDTPKDPPADDVSVKLASKEEDAHSKQQVEDITGRSGGEDKPLPRKTPVKTTTQDIRERHSGQQEGIRGRSGRENVHKSLPRPTPEKTATQGIREGHSRRQKDIRGRSGGENKPLPRKTPVKTTTQDIQEGHSEQQQTKARERKDTQERHVPTKAPPAKGTPQTYSKDSHGAHNPPPLTLASFLGERTHVQRPQRSGRNKELSSNSLREVEMEQLKTRFPGESCKLLAKGKDRITYAIDFQPSDQDWRGPPVITMEITFPMDYPNKHCHIEIPPHQELDPALVASGNKAIADYWKPDALGGLMFRPFLHWWDKSLVDILHIPLLPSIDTVVRSEGNDEGDKGVELSGDKAEGVESTKQTQAVVKSKRGTEIRFSGLDVSQTLGTAFWTTIRMVLSCARCKNHQETDLKEERLYSIICGRCNNTMCAVYHLAIIHTSSATLGYLELTGCSPVEVNFQFSPVSMTCLNCSSEASSPGFSIGQPKDVFCRHCHDKMTLHATGLRFFQHQQNDTLWTGNGTVTTVVMPKKENKIHLNDGQPLTLYGICEHYKKSHRWLRFPCCGRAFPCDVCHDTAQDHPMERANRMICGYCSKEQGYSGICVRCDADLTSSRHSSHWEGGQGCRNRTKMHRLDKQKYKNSDSKTTCKKSERVGKTESK